MLYFSKYKIISILCISFFAVFIAIGNFVPSDSYFKNFFYKKNINLGLDLKGGSHLLLKIDFSSYLNDQLKNLSDNIKENFRKDKIRSIPSIKNNKVIFHANDKYKKKVENIISKLNYQDLKIQNDNNKYEISFTKSKINKLRVEVVNHSIEIIRKRIDEHGTKEPIIHSQGRDNILIQIPGVFNPENVKRLLGKTAKMTFHFVEQTKSDILSDKNTIKRNDVLALKDKKGRSFFVNKEVILQGDMLTDANPTYYEGQPAVSFKFNSIGTKKFAKITQENIGKIFAIVLDNQIVTAPRINTVINQGLGVISGDFTSEEANEVALLLRAGALPAPLSIIEEKVIGPSLGLDSIKSGSYATIIALLLVSISMIIFYKIFGIIANIALVVNICLILSFLSLIQATLTLPGIAGIALTIGIAVDANIIIFERIKEEIKNNKKLLSAIEDGFSKSFKAIIDANLTTIIVSVFLYIFGTGAIKGFSVTLLIGVLSSMFSALLLARMLIVFYVRKKIRMFPDSKNIQFF